MKIYNTSHEPNVITLPGNILNKPKGWLEMQLELDLLPKLRKKTKYQ